MQKLVIVESPTKARTIEKYLPDEYQVLASVGHVRDLPDKASQLPEKFRKEPWAHLGVNVDADFDPVYVVKDARSKKAIQELKSALARADELLLATDEDREGEAIGWHLLEVLKPKVPVKRMVFHEITKTAIQEALGNTRKIDDHLVQAQEARRILDRLVGYPLSLLLAKKIKYGLSAGRVQSVAVRLLVERERERRRFVVSTYWDLLGRFAKQGSPFQAEAISVDGKRLATGKDFDETTGKIPPGKDVLLLDEATARRMETDLSGASFRVASVSESPYQTSPKAPFTTSTLQQEAGRKLAFGARDTMSVAQRLYENGFITYMRTDSTNLSQQAIDAARKAVGDLYGPSFLPASPRRYTSKSKGAQEAHEAIRPSGDAFVKPEASGLDGRELKLYDLIWKRTVACQMVDARCTRIRADLEASASGHSFVFRATGKRIDFPGYLRAYVEGTDDPDAELESQEKILPPLATGETVANQGIEAVGHETKPPARYTEASLVKALEENGIGRPSTYASILSKIVNDSEYARKQGSALVPTYLAFATTAFLERHFPDLVDLRFTAQMEDQLDEIARGAASKVRYLHDFYRSEQGFAARIQENEEKVDPAEARVVELEGLPAVMKVGRYGPYVQLEQGGETRNANVPDDIAPADLTMEEIERRVAEGGAGPKVLGEDPETGKKVYLMRGPYGPYVQLGETAEAPAPEAPAVEEAAAEETAPSAAKGKGKGKPKKKAAAKKKKAAKAPKPKRCSVPRGEAPDSLTLERALALLALPRLLGDHPADGKPVHAGLGRFGPYLRHGDEFRSVPAGEDLFTIGLEKALEILAQPKRTRGGGNQKVLRDLGAHPKSGKPVLVYEGRYGPYLKSGLATVTVPKDQPVETLTVEKALELIAAKRGAGRRGGARGRA